jgi:serine/threonine protein kinase/class 3 adenylate cyclase/dienelactone hydrolase
VLTLVFTDLVDSTALKAEIGDDAAGDLIERHRQHVQAFCSSNDGRVIDWAGDGCFMTYETPSAAVRFSLALQQTHSDSPDLPKVRVGIHMGEVSERTGPDGPSGPPRVEGLAVDLAARIQSLSAPGQILMSNAVFNNARQRLNSKTVEMHIAWRAHGGYLFKGFDDPLDIGEVGIEGISPLNTPEGSEKAKRAVAPTDEEALGWRPAAGLIIPGHDHWVLVDHLGVGGFGEVWLASNSHSGEKHVFKFCFQPDRVRGLKREVVLFRLLKETLGDREDIARVLDWEFEKAPYFIEAEYSEGGDLKQWAEEQEGIENVPLDTRLDVVGQVARALSAAHGAGVLHKDVKPTNILLTKGAEKPRAILTDFGIGLLTDPNALKEKGITATGLTETLVAGSSSSTSGTGMYLAPELHEGKAPSAKSDIFSLGVVLYQMVVGDLSRSIASGWERDVDDLVLREDIAACVDRDPENRLDDAAELADRLDRLGERQSAAGLIERGARRRRKAASLAVPALALVSLIAISLVLWNSWNNSGQEKIDWAREEAIPEITRLMEEEDFFGAYLLIQEAQEHLADDPMMAQLIQDTTVTGIVETEPAGARIYIKEYAKPEQEWRYLGDSPLKGIRLPQGSIRVKMEMPGYDDFIVGGRTRYFARENEAFKLFTKGTLPPGMTEIPTWNNVLQLAGLAKTEGVRIPAFLIDKYEVTNAQFKEFVDAGGYESEAYWEHPIVSEGKTLPFNEAVKFFRDSTGRRGPSSWEGGTFPAGKDSHPVSGVSWYEASAYAKWAGKRLPTVFHWQNAAYPGFGEVIQFSNFGGEGTEAAGSNPSLGIFDIYDAAGNVKEWCENAADADGLRRYILGGGFSDPQYMYTLADAQPSLDRSPGNGFRCMQYGSDAPPDWVGRTILRSLNQKTTLSVTDDTFALLEKMYSYDRAPLNVEDAVLDSDSEHWSVEKVSYDAAYGGERIDAFLYLPKNVEPPYQSVVFFPGLNAFGDISSEFLAEGPYRLTQSVVQSGRAVIFPIYKGSYDRNMADALPEMHQPFLNPFQFSTEKPFMYRDWMVQAVKDTFRTVDYLESRDDMDGDSMAYWGISLGSYIGTITLGLEDRFKAGVFMIGGIVPDEMPHYEVEPAVFAPRISTPLLMLNGDLDFIFPVETGQKPLFELLGTTAEDKNWRTFANVGHEIPPRVADDFMIETLAWLEKYLGRVE